MSPRAIVENAQAAGLPLIAVCDHNTSANCRAVAGLASDAGLAVIPGMEVTSQEEAHILVLFPSLEAAEEFGEFIYTRLPAIGNDPTRFGDQVIVDASGEILGEIDKYLGMATDLTVDQILEEGHARGALVVPSHIDRPYAGIIAQLGFLPPLDFDGVEVAWERNLASAGPYPPLASSDAHIPELIGTKKSILLDEEDAGFKALVRALRSGRINRIYEDSRLPSV